MLCNFSLGAIFSSAGIMGADNMIWLSFLRLLQHCQAMVFRGHWEARVLIGDQLQVDDRGSCEQIISLDVPDVGPWTLQALIDVWGEKARIHAPVSAPHWPALRLNRL